MLYVKKINPNKMCTSCSVILWFNPSGFFWEVPHKRWLLLVTAVILLVVLPKLLKAIR